VKNNTIAILGINGYKNSGKTTLIEKLLPVLIKNNLKVAVIKKTHHPLSLDTIGSDTHRIYQAGGDVLACDGESVFTRSHSDDSFSLGQAIDVLGDSYDLILVEGFKASDIDRVWLLRPEEQLAPTDIKNIIVSLPFTDDRLAWLLPVLQSWLKKKYGITITDYQLPASKVR
jgi:molybdopterin-guanine dinucleotide biosynthesis adapter protein